MERRARQADILEAEVDDAQRQRRLDVGARIAQRHVALRRHEDEADRKRHRALHSRSGGGRASKPDQVGPSPAKRSQDWPNLAKSGQVSGFAVLFVLNGLGRKTSAVRAFSRRPPTGSDRRPRARAPDGL